MAPVLAPTAPTPIATPPAGAAPPRASALAQALQAHDELPDAQRAARVLRCLDNATPGESAGPGDNCALPALQALLAPTDALVVFGRHGEELLACIVRRGRVQVVRRLACWREVQAAWRLARFQLAAVRHGAGPLQPHLDRMTKRAQERLQGLHHVLWSTLADELTAARRLLLMPSAGLAGVPFAALHDGMTCLAQRHLLAEVTSLQQALLALQQPDGPLQVDVPRAAAHPRSQRQPTAGATRRLACRWLVDEAVTEAFARRFTQERLRGRTPAEALAEAQVGLMVHHGHPAFWAGFVLHGGW